MKQTALQELIKIIKQKRKESEISNTLLKFVQIEAEKLLETEKQQQDDFAIGFAEYCLKFDNLKNESTYLIEQLLEIYKKTL